MEVLNERIREWLKVEDGTGYGSSSGDGFGSSSSSGDGFGSSSGYGYGSGYGTGFGYGSGSGSGFGYGYGYGSGSGTGFGSSSGDGYGYGSGYGHSSGLKSVNGQYIWNIDNIQTIITAVSKNVAKGFILNRDLTLKPCYVVKSHNKFAHGETIKKAMRDLEEKIFEDMDTEEIIQEFIKKFSKDKKYKGTTFYKWHHNLTGSCEMGRNSFVQNHNLNLNKLYSVKEFIELTENDYGGEVIKQLKKYYN